MTLDPRLYKGDEAIAAKHFKRWPRPRDLLIWALDVKIGDYIATCEGCNRKVTEIEPYFVLANQFGDEEWDTDEKTEILHEIRFTDSRGRWHHCPGGGCAGPKETPEEVTTYFREWAFDEKYPERIRKWYGDKKEKVEKALVGWKRMQETFNTGQPVVDEYGELLPEFENAE